MIPKNIYSNLKSLFPVQSKAITDIEARKNKFLAYLDKILLKNGITRDVLAIKCEISPASLYHQLKSSRNLSPDLLNDILGDRVGLRLATLELEHLCELYISAYVTPAVRTIFHASIITKLFRHHG